MASAGRSPRPTEATLCLPPYSDKCHRCDVRVPTDSPSDPVPIVPLGMRALAFSYFRMATATSASTATASTASPTFAHSLATRRRLALRQRRLLRRRVAITEQTSSAVDMCPGEVRTTSGAQRLIPQGCPSHRARTTFELHEKVAPGDEGGGLPCCVGSDRPLMPDPGVPRACLPEYRRGGLCLVGVQTLFGKPTQHWMQQSARLIPQ